MLDFLWKIGEKLLVDYIYWFFRKEPVRFIGFLSLTGLLILSLFFAFFGSVPTPVLVGVIGVYLTLAATAFAVIGWKYAGVVELQMDCLKNMCSLLPTLPTDREHLVKITQQILRELRRGTAGSSFGGKPVDVDQWRASVLVYDGSQLKEFASISYPPGTRLAFVNSVSWGIFTGRSPREGALTCPGDLDKHIEFVRQAIVFPVDVPRSRSMACVRIETDDGFRIGTVQVASPKVRAFDHKKIRHFMHAAAEILASILLSDPNRKKGEIPNGIKVYVF